MRGELFFLILIYFWLHQVLVVARRIFIVARGLLSSCGVQVFSLVAWEPMGSSCGTWDPKHRANILDISKCSKYPIFWLFHINRIIKYVVFCDWLLSPSTMCSRFIDVLACISTSFLFMAE